MVEEEFEIWYHGTSPKNAELIVNSGQFNIGTWFARKEEHALRFGGPTVFQVRLEKDLISADVDWQLHTLVPIPTSRIVAKV